MTRFYAFICALALSMFLGGCGITGPVPPPGTPGVTNCSDTALHQALVGLVPNVESALAQANYTGAESALTSILISLTASVGAPLALAELNCVIAWVISKAETSASVTADSLEATKVGNGKLWMAKHPADITGAAAF